MRKTHATCQIEDVISQLQTYGKNRTHSNLYSAGAEAGTVAAAAADGVALLVAVPVDAAGVAVENEQKCSKIERSTMSTKTKMKRYW